MYAQDNNSLPVWIILSSAHHHISINSQPFLAGIVSSWELTYQVGSGDPGCTMDVHILVNPPDIFEELLVDRYIDGGLIIK